MLKWSIAIDDKKTKDGTEGGVEPPKESSTISSARQACGEWWVIGCQYWRGTRHWHPPLRPGPWQIPHLCPRLPLFLHHPLSCNLSHIHLPSIFTYDTMLHSYTKSDHPGLTLLIYCKMLILTVIILSPSRPTPSSWPSKQVRSPTSSLLRMASRHLSSSGTTFSRASTRCSRKWLRESSSPGILPLVGSLSAVNGRPNDVLTLSKEMSLEDTSSWMDLPCLPCTVLAPSSMPWCSVEGCLYTWLRWGNGDSGWGSGQSDLSWNSRD